MSFPSPQTDHRRKSWVLCIQSAAHFSRSHLRVESLRYLITAISKLRGWKRILHPFRIRIMATKQPKIWKEPRLLFFLRPCSFVEDMNWVEFVHLDVFVTVTLTFFSKQTSNNVNFKGPTLQTKNLCHSSRHIKEDPDLLTHCLLFRIVRKK